MVQRLTLFIFILSACACQSQPQRESKDETSILPDHEAFTQILKDYVFEDGVNYKALQKDSIRLNVYLNNLSDNPPNQNWTKVQRLAYWINAYNAFTLKLIIDHYPVESITDLHPTIHIPLVNTVWHKKFFNIGGNPMSLDHIEHQILRKDFEEPIIHFAINCASISCPPLRNEAFEPHKLNEQLEEQAINFINDPTRNLMDVDNPKISKIFSWFSGDFKDQGSLIDYLNQYSKVKIESNADVDYLKYDWGLNDVSQ